MKQKILNSKLIKRISEFKLSKALSGHRFFGKFFNYEFISYIICGVLTTVVSYVVFYLAIGLPTVVANTISFIAAVLFAYVVNKVFVFDSPEWSGRMILKEFIPFVVTRILSYVLETLFLVLTCDVLHLHKFLMKVVAGVVVIILNYFAGKFLVFRKREKAHAENKEEI